jgi:hypothetical protein
MGGTNGGIEESWHMTVDQANSTMIGCMLRRAALRAAVGMTLAATLLGLCAPASAQTAGAQAGD